MQSPSLDDDNNSTTHSDIDDEELRQMGQDAMRLLKSLSDDLNEMDGPKAKEKKAIPHMNDLNISDHNDDDDDDDDDDHSISDDSIIKELGALHDVTKEIERELQHQNSFTMKHAIAEIMDAKEDPLQRVMSEDDQEIVQRILGAEGCEYKPNNEWERMLTRFRLEGISDGGIASILAALCVLVWSVVLRLTWNVTHGEIA